MLSLQTMPLQQRLSLPHRTNLVPRAFPLKVGGPASDSTATDAGVPAKQTTRMLPIVIVNKRPCGSNNFFIVKIIIIFLILEFSPQVILWVILVLSPQFGLWVILVLGPELNLPVILKLGS